MISRVLAGSLMVLVIAGVAPAQQWAEKMFETTQHDFGSVARGSTAVYSFKLKNIYREPVHISGVRTSCGCTQPRIAKDTLKTYETGEIIAEFNTRSFLGDRRATITVSFDQPFPAEIQLQVQGYVRSDVVFDPGEVRFGEVDEGEGAETAVRVNYAGRDDWQIKDIKSTYDHFEVEINRSQPRTGRVDYDLVVRLKSDAPAGQLIEQLVLVTNDARMPNIPLQVEGRIVPELTVTPDALYLGDVTAGETITKRIVVRGKRPFELLDVKCSDECFQFETEQKSETLYLVSVSFTPRELGAVKRAISIRTDRYRNALELAAHANVVPSVDSRPGEKLGQNSAP